MKGFFLLEKTSHYIFREIIYRNKENQITVLDYTKTIKFYKNKRESK